MLVIFMRNLCEQQHQIASIAGWTTKRTADTHLANACLLVLERFEFRFDNPARRDAALYAPTPATYRHLGDLTALGLEHDEPDVIDAEFDERHAAAARAGMAIPSHVVVGVYMCVRERANRRAGWSRDLLSVNVIRMAQSTV